jgi:tetratricopeptide (TPR) repeat protein
MYRSLGQNEEALTQAQRLSEAVPDDALTRLDVAELSLTLGRLDEAEAAFAALREIDDIPGHEAYPLHGLILVDIARQDWTGALELAVQARAIDPHGLAGDVEAFLRGKSGDAQDGSPPPSQEQIEAALNNQLTEYRRMHADDRRAGAGSIIG